MLVLAMGLAAVFGVLSFLPLGAPPALARSAAPAGSADGPINPASTGPLPAGPPPPSPLSADPAPAGPGEADSAGEPPPPSGIQAGAWLVADADSGAILAAHNPHQPDLPASTMKILTALTVLPGLPPDQMVLVGDDAARVDGTRVGLVPGVYYSVRDLATAMIIASGNDATVALVNAAGGKEKVLARMNAKAAALGARSTVAGDPTGLDAPGQVTTVHDLAVLGRAALNDPIVRGYLTIPRATLHGREGERFEIANHNALIGSYEGAVGVKNGYTTAAGATFVGAATRGDRTLVVALLRTVPAYAADARALLDWGFEYADRVKPVGRLAGPPDADSEAAAGAARPGRTDEVAAGSAGGDGSSAASDGNSIGPVTWTAIGITASASLITLLARVQQARRARRARLARAARRRDGASRPERALAGRSAARRDGDARRRPRGHGSRGHGTKGYHTRSRTALGYRAGGYLPPDRGRGWEHDRRQERANAASRHTSCRPAETRWPDTPIARQRDDEPCEPVQFREQ